MMKLRSRSQSLIAIVVLTAALLAPASAGAATVKPSAAAEDHENHYFIGVNAQSLSLLGTDVEFAIGAGAFFEMTVINHWLELELAVHVLSIPATGKVELPIELLAKIPFHPADWVTIYVGVGPMVTPYFSTTSGLYAGVATALGAYFWFSQHFGISAELNDNFVFSTSTGKFVYEVGGTVGVVYGF
jgi:hypothetical protein